MNRSKETGSKLKELEAKNNQSLLRRKRREDYDLSVRAAEEGIGSVEGLTDEEKQAFFREQRLKLQIEYGMEFDPELSEQPEQKSLAALEQTGLVLAEEKQGLKTKENVVPKILQIAPFIKEGTIVTREDDRSIIRLEKLLSLVKRGEVKRFPCEVSDIQEYLGHEASATIPQELVKKLSFDGLKWEFVYPSENDKSLFFLFLGGSRLKNGQINYNDALGTIFAEKMIYHDRNPNFGKVSEMMHVSVAGVDYESNKIIASKYNFFNGMKMGRLNVSVSEVDCFKRYKTDSLVQLRIDPVSMHLRHSIDGVPTRLEWPQQHAGLITKAMKDKVFTHREKGRILRIENDRGIEFNSRIDGGELEELGYYIGEGLNSYKVGFRAGKEEEDVPLSSWEVSVPKILERTNGIARIGRVFGRK